MGVEGVRTAEQRKFQLSVKKLTLSAQPSSHSSNQDAQTKQEGHQHKYPLDETQISIYSSLCLEQPSPLA